MSNALESWMCLFRPYPNVIAYTIASSYLLFPLLVAKERMHASSSTSSKERTLILRISLTYIKVRKREISKVAAALSINLHQGYKDSFAVRM